MPLTPQDALALPADRLGAGSPIGLAVVPDSAAMTTVFADMLLAEYRAALAAGRRQVVFIVPVGPVGQYEKLADRCNAEGQDLHQLVLINMDEYLAADGTSISPDDPLSFRGHMIRNFWQRIDPALAPHHPGLFPDPQDWSLVPRAITALDGVDAAFGGVGVTGHLAFNDPPEPGEPTDPDAFARLPTRAVSLSRETVIIAAVNSAGGNVARIPRRAMTVGMREILGARKVRLFMHRAYGGAMLRLMLHGPVTATVPASLLQRHPDAVVTVTQAVTGRPEPQ
jgi:glucosamine-6-phosphate deaminase